MPMSVGRTIKIMISSTSVDLDQYREEASKIIRKVAEEKEKLVQLFEVSMERRAEIGDRKFAVELSKRLVEESDWVVVIVGWNYGWISDEPGADGLSVTEWECRHAFNLNKKVFVFIAGDPETANEYRVSPEETVDLKNWIFKQEEDQAAKLKQFRKQLSKRHAEMFANLQMFRERLEKTLKDAVAALPPPPPPPAKVFISYAEADTQFAHQLCEDLKHLYIDVWIAPENILPGEEWADAINRALKKCTHLVTVLTPSALESKFVQLETNTGIALERKGRIKLIPLDVISCDPPPLWTSYQTIPFQPNYKEGLRKLSVILKSAQHLSK